MLSAILGDISSALTSLVTIIPSTLANGAKTLLFDTTTSTVSLTAPGVCIVVGLGLAIVIGAGRLALRIFRRHG